MRIGTNCFVSLKLVYKYYYSQGYDNEAIKQKLEDKEAIVGKPELKQGQDLRIDRDGRYYIEE
jgi:hypothetical protein